MNRVSRVWARICSERWNEHSIRFWRTLRPPRKSEEEFGGSPYGGSLTILYMRFIQNEYES